VEKVVDESLMHAVQDNHFEAVVEEEEEDYGRHR